MAARTYSKTNGTCVMQEMYGVNLERDKTLSALGYTYQSAKDWAPAFVGYCESRGWTQAEVLSLYEFETAWNDYVIATNFYLGGGIYYPPNNIYHSRAQIIAPDGYYRLHYGCMTALGTYTGKHSNTYSDRTGANPGCSAGTALEIDHNGWLSARQPDRIGLFASAWASDFSIVGGAAYQEGLIIENFRVVGGMGGKSKDSSFKGYGIAVSNPGECSVVRNCMLTDNNDAGLAIISGTPGYIDACSFFFNKSEGILCLGNNGLANTTILIPSGDDQPALIRFKPLPGSVCGGTYTIIGLKSESRDVMQRPIVVDGSIGQLNLIINGMTCDHKTLSCPELIAINGNGPWQVEVHGLQYGNNVQSLLYDAQSGKRLTGGAAFRGNTFGLNSEDGLYLKSRANMTWPSGGVVTPPVDPPPTTGTITATASVSSATEQGVLREPKYMVDGNANSFWMGMGGMTNGQKVTITFPAVRKMKGLTFKMPIGYTNSFPKKYEVRVSAGGAYATLGNFVGAATSAAAWTERDVLSVEIICREANPSAYWGISEVIFQ